MPEKWENDVVYLSGLCDTGVTILPYYIKNAVELYSQLYCFNILPLLSIPSLPLKPFVAPTRLASSPEHNRYSIGERNGGFQARAGPRPVNIEDV